MANRLDILCWFDEGVRKGATHLVVVCDTFEYEDYPIYVMPTDNLAEVTAKHNGPNMQRVSGVYDLRKNKTEQLDARQVH